jgi:hypothetical protein
VEKPIDPMINRKNIDIVNPEVPLKLYKKDLLDYYELGLSSNDPILSYISFYHILEYFFEKVTKEKSIKNLKECFDNYDDSSPNTNIDNQLYRIAKNTCNKNEKPQLNEVLHRYLDKEHLIKSINSIRNMDFNYFKKTDVKFVRRNTKIKDKNDEQLVETLTDRIYEVKCALVHQKEEYESRYSLNNPKHKEALYKEIPLIKFLAEKIICKSADNFDIPK